MRKAKNPKPLKSFITAMNGITKDSRLNPKGRILTSLLSAWASDAIDIEDRRLLRAIIIAQFVTKGGFEFSDEPGLGPGGLAEKAPNTKIEQDAQESVTKLLAKFIGGNDASTGQSEQPDTPATSQPS
jgi:hypothetical protein